MNRFKYIILVLILSSTISIGQNLTIEGVVYNSANKEALPYANVFLPNSFNGTISNSNGEFKLLVPQESARDSLTVSFIGYHSQTFSITDLTSPVVIYLNENTTALSEVIVTGYTAETIIKMAIENIPNNYFIKPYKSKGFYRVTSEKDNSYIHLSEAVFDIYQSKLDKPYKQFKLDKMRAIKDEKASKGIDLGLRPGSIYGFDIVNNTDGIEIINKTGLKQHHFTIEGTEYIDGHETYKIAFDQKDINKSGYKGYLLIDKKDLAFIYFNFGLSPKGLVYKKFGDAALRTLLKMVGIQISMNRNAYQILYKKFGDRYYINNVGNDATLTFKSERDHYNFKADTRVDYVVTNIEIDTVYPFTNNEILGKGKLIEEQNVNYDTDFWKDYTIVLPTNDFTEITEILEANNKANNTKLKLEDKLAKLPKDKSTRIDSILSFYNKRNLFNGNALITYKGQVIHNKSYNNELTHNNKNSQFRIGSVSKTFTSMLLAQLENRGKIQYTDSIHQYLPEYPNGEITIAQLLSHQSGIPNYLDNTENLTRIMSKKYTIEELVYQFCSDPLSFEPGDRFEYSNSNYVILGLIIETITGQPFADALDQYIFKPLGMTHTYAGVSVDTTHLSKGFHYGKPEPQYPQENVIGAGGITSTTNDLLSWSKALDNETLLPLAKINQMFQPKSDYTDWDAYYGYGWLIDRYMFTASKKNKIVYHPGTDYGFFSMFVKEPDEDITIILLNNTGEFPRFEISELILNELN